MCEGLGVARREARRRRSCQVTFIREGISGWVKKKLVKKEKIGNKLGKCVVVVGGGMKNDSIYVRKKKTDVCVRKGKEKGKNEEK